MNGAASSRYTAIAIALHWAMAALLLFMIWLGWNMEDNEARYQLHKSIGITILFLALARLAWRFANPPPAMPGGITKLEKTASYAAHAAFYVLMIAIPLGGWLLVSVSPFQVATVLFGLVSWPHLPFTEELISEDFYKFVEFFHSKGAWVIIGLLGLHIAGAVKHEFGAEDGVLKKMMPGMFGKTSPPALPARGFLFAFGGSLALFAAIATLAWVGAGPALSGPLPAAGSGPAISENQPNWLADYESSEITFAGLHEGKEFKGVFESWAAEVAFFPDELSTSGVRVIVDMRTAKTGKKLYDDSLKSREWFNAAAFPQAMVELSSFREASSGFEATATLTLKGKPASVPLSFALDIEGDEARLEGSATFSRKALDLGQVSDPGAAYVSDTVTVTISGRATRKP